jgi:transposase-like protein
MSAHLGYAEGEKPLSDNKRNGYSEKTIKGSNGEHRIEVPRDRQGTFDPVTVPKHQSVTEELETAIILLYGKGMSNADIINFIELTYGVKYSTSQVSIITNSLMEDIREWQQRPLEDQYAVVWIDAIHYKIRQDGKVISKACMVILGVDMQGRQDILSLHIVQTESASSWALMLNDLISRGVKDILILCSDNLNGLEKAVQATFPQAVRQICIVHQVRNTLRYVSDKDRRTMIKDVKTIYQADNEEMAVQAFDVFKGQWSVKYNMAVRSWEENWTNLTAFLQYPKEIRKLIYTTNIIESFNASLRKYTKNKKVFPNDDAALKSIYLAAQQISNKWQKSRFGWAQIFNQLYIYFEERIIL